MVHTCPHCGVQNNPCPSTCGLVKEFKYYAGTGGWDTTPYKAHSFEKKSGSTWEPYTPSQGQRGGGFEFKWFSPDAKATHFRPVSNFRTDPVEAGPERALDNPSEGGPTHTRRLRFEWTDSWGQYRGYISQELWDRIKRYIAALKRKTFNPLEMPAPLWTIIYKFKPGRGARALEYSSPMAAYNELVKKANEWRQTMVGGNVGGAATGFAIQAYTTELLKNPWGSPGGWTFTQNGRVRALTGDDASVPFIQNYSQHPAQTFFLMRGDGIGACGLRKPDGSRIIDKDWKYHPIQVMDGGPICSGVRAVIHRARRPEAGQWPGPNRSEFIMTALNKFKENYGCLSFPTLAARQWNDYNRDSTLARRSQQWVFQRGINPEEVADFKNITDVYCFAELVRTMACNPQTEHVRGTNPDYWFQLRPAVKVLYDDDETWCGWSWMLEHREITPPVLTPEQIAAAAEREARLLAERLAKQKEREYQSKRREELERELQLLRSPEYVKECVIAECDDPNDPIHGDVNFARPPEDEHTCCVCLGGEEEGQLFQIACGHIFHKDCISQAVQSSVGRQGKCPLCRAPTFGKALKPYTQLNKTIETQTDYDSDADSDVYGPVVGAAEPVRLEWLGMEEWRAARLARFG